MIRQTHILNGYKFTSPLKFGFGIQLKLADAQKKFFIDDNPDKTIQDINDVTGKSYFEEWMLANASDYRIILATLQAILKPNPGSPSVEEAFEEASTEEVQSIMGFISQTLNPNIEKPTELQTNGIISDQS